MIMETSPREDPSALLKYCSPYVADGCILLSSVGHHVSRDIYCSILILEILVMLRTTKQL